MVKCLKILVTVLALCQTVQSDESPPAQYSNGALSNNTSVPILTWSSGYGYVICPPWQEIGWGMQGVGDCDWYFNPFTGKWVKITPWDFVWTLSPKVFLYPHKEHYTPPWAMPPPKPNLRLPRGPGTPEEWDGSMTPEHRSLLEPWVNSSEVDATSKPQEEPIESSPEGISQP